MAPRKSRPPVFTSGKVMSSATPPTRSPHARSDGIRPLLSFIQ